MRPAPRRSGSGCGRLGLVVSVALLGCAAEWASARAQDSPAPSWREVKCARYTQSASALLARTGTRGVSRAFLDAHEAFLTSGCTTSHDVCPRTAEELQLANTLVVLAMNAGTASTFPPFACGK